ncbi:MAG TPA: hypothetical protein VMP01_17535 [Pirellulaceae bacterium]|nr:hypothetical protein [Pirellulaceae bacterium]
MKYHHEAAKLLPHRLRVSDAAAKAVQQRELELDITFPAAVREWYSIEGASALLAAYSNDDRPIELSKLGAPFDDWYGGGPRNFVPEGLLLFMCENQGVCNWAVKLDGTPDPAVVVEVDTAPNADWLPCAEHFSIFTYCQIWDHSSREAGVAAQETELSPNDLAFLKSHFRELPTTNRWPGNANYRFENECGAILIWDGGDCGADWFAWSRTASGLESLLHSIWHCGELSQTFYEIEGPAAAILKKLRS